MEISDDYNVTVILDTPMCKRISSLFRQAFIKCSKIERVKNVGGRSEYIYIHMLHTHL